MTTRVYGVTSGSVIDVQDPEALGRVRVVFTWMEGENNTYWAPIATLMTGPERGCYYMPEIGDEVLVAFYQGDVNHPYVIGFLRSGASKPPVTDIHRRIIRSVNGHEIELYDPGEQDGDKGYVRLKDAHGNIVELSNAVIKIRGVGTVTIDAPHVFINGRRVTMTGGTI